MSADSLALLAEALTALALASLKLRFVSFRRLVRSSRRTLGMPAGETDLDRLVWSVRRVSRWVPFRAKCFESALSLQWMLRRRKIGSTLHYGIRSTPTGSLCAHVWLSVGDRIVIGGEVADQFTLIASFPDLCDPGDAETAS